MSTDLTLDQIRQRLHDLDELAGLVPLNPDLRAIDESMTILTLDEYKELKEVIEYEEEMLQDWDVYKARLERFGIFLGSKENTDMTLLEKTCEEKHLQMMRELEESIPGWGVFQVEEQERHCIAPAHDIDGKEWILPSWWGDPQEVVK